LRIEKRERERKRKDEEREMERMNEKKRNNGVAAIEVSELQESPSQVIIDLFFHLHISHSKTKKIRSYFWY
jgi:hypothetical protein